MIHWHGSIRDYLPEGLPHLSLSATGPVAGSPEGTRAAYLVKIVRAWRRPDPSDAVWLRLALPPVEVASSPIYPPDLRLCWLGTIDNAVYAIVEPTTSEPGEAVTRHHVVRLIDDRQLAPLREHEIYALRDQLEDAVERHPSTALDAVVRQLGPIPEEGSTEFYAACLAERGIVGHLQIGWEIVDPGETVVVRELRDVTGDPLRIKLATPSGEGPGEELEIRRQLSLDGERYLVLYPPFRTWLPGKPSPHHLAVLRPSGVGALAGDVEISRVGHRLIEELELDRPDGRFRPLGRVEPDERSRLVELLGPMVTEVDASPEVPSIGPPPPILPPPPLLVPPTPPTPELLVTSLADLGATEAERPGIFTAEPAPVTPRVCEVCGRQDDEGFPYCVNCGSELTLRASPPLRETPPAPATPTAGCIGCGAGLNDPGAVCQACGTTRTGPLCPRCGQPVFSVDDDGERAPHFARLSWNTGWDGRCQRCGLAFSVQVRASEHSVVEIRRAEAAFSDVPDSFHYVPTVEIVARREPFGWSGREWMPAEVRIELTVDEVRAVLEQLTGPLDILTRQRPWWFDGT